MSLVIDMAETGLMPDRLIRFGIRRLDRKRLQDENLRHGVNHRQSLDRFISDMQQNPIAIKTDKANEQHYEVPPSFFEQVLGRHLKYSGCYWPDGVENLDQAEERMLEMTCWNVSAAGWRAKAKYLSIFSPIANLPMLSISAMMTIGWGAIFLAAG